MTDIGASAGRDVGTAYDLLAMALDRLQEDQRALELEYARRLDDINRKIAAVKLAMGSAPGVVSTPDPNQQFRLFSEDDLPPEKPIGAKPSRLAWRSVLVGKTQEDALIRIAQEFGGELVLKDARNILVEAGITKSSPKNLPGQVYRVVAQSPSFERVSPGVFRLRTPEEIERMEAFIKLGRNMRSARDAAKRIFEPPEEVDAE